jgi:hypothetical protein
MSPATCRHARPTARSSSRAKTRARARRKARHQPGVKAREDPGPRRRHRWRSRTSAQAAQQGDGALALHRCPFPQLQPISAARRRLILRRRHRRHPSGRVSTSVGQLQILHDHRLQPVSRPGTACAHSGALSPCYMADHLRADARSASRSTPMATLNRSRRNTHRRPARSVRTGHHDPDLRPSWCRRFHDIGITGWAAIALVIPFLNMLTMIALALVPGSPNDNRYGPAPD